ncbi:MAG: FKBP-type peptidyl-prolyl cis-trans isomerase N-terminal domain-containing protein, partial [Sulfurimonas sp.]|nr:FKBP-type peptidyl-prolyl cis-trans isomerase N-terminal domain-containing protein [Sulfurimonas sp.]
MSKLLPTVIGCLALITTSAMAGNSLKSQEQKAGYVIGIQLGKQLMISKDDIDLDAMKQGMKDVFTGKKPKLSNDDMRKAMTTYQET